VRQNLLSHVIGICYLIFMKNYISSIVLSALFFSSTAFAQNTDLEIDPGIVTRAAAEMDMDVVGITEELETNALPSLKIEQDEKIYDVLLVPNENTEMPRPKLIPKKWKKGTWVPQERRHFKWYQKINPIFWLGNSEDKTPPAWFRPNDRFRNTKWYFRNPAHNFTFYVIGVSDKVGTPSHASYGIAPDDVFNRQGGWNVIVHQVKLVGRISIFLPFVSYWDKRMKVYFGWRQSGNFGIKLTRNKDGI